MKGAKEFSKELPDVINLVELEHRPSGAFLSDYVSGEMKAGDRKGKIDRLKALDGFDRGILTNARCLAEGVDVPSLDGVAFIDPKGMVLLSDDEHGQLVAVTFEACAEALGVQLVGKVAEALLGKRVRDPLPIDHLALGKRNVHRVWNPVFEVVGFEVGGCDVPVCL